MTKTTEGRALAQRLPKVYVVYVWLLLACHVLYCWQETACCGLLCAQHTLLPIR